MSGSAMEGLSRRLPFDDPYESAEKLVSWAEPLLSTEELDLSRRAVMDFCAGPASLLQRELNRLRKGDDEILELIPYWRGWYLEQREPLPVHVNPFYLFDGDEITEDDPLRLAARLSLAAASFCSRIDRGDITPDEFRGEPLCMDRYDTMFRSSRGAFSGKDRVMVGDPESLAGRSALVSVRGRLFMVELISPEGELRDLNDLVGVLKSLWLDGGEDELPIGLMTCPDRDGAARIRRELCMDEENVRALASLEGALFALCLDGDCGPDLYDGARHFLFDGGRNRWLEKSFQIVVTTDGHCGLNFEHSGRDGTYVGRLVREILAGCGAAGAGRSDMSDPSELTFSRSPRLVELLEKARKDCEELGNSIVQRPFVFDLFGRERIKSGGVSPDAFVQTAMLLAQRDIWDDWQSVYESVQLRRFKGGRTEGTRPLTTESAAFVEAFLSGKSDDEMLKSLLQKAGEAHRDRIAQCMDGKGPEGHLSLLRRIWRERGDDLNIPKEPELYSSPAWRRLTRNVISSSTTRGDGLRLAGYGPAELGGLSSRYLSRRGELIFHVASWKSDGDLADRYVASLKKALSEMEKIL